MLILTDPRTVIIPSNKVSVSYNLTSLLEVERVNILPPLIDGYNEFMTDQYSVRLSQLIVGDNRVFVEFFGKIIYPLYCGYDVYLFVSRGGMYDYISECLLEFIYRAYGYHGAIINEPGDLDFVEEGFFSRDGIINLDYDKERYIRLVGVPEVGDCSV